ncbi:pyruvate kinase [Gordonia jinghuaiqii]|uniref:pyruvate kinase n=1 Tax=Gordonia jinghuaiqii TaxID=2758710 RepID=A0A7D7LPR6_9ACTN|nr:pyruvate kinase [Gordonia jinghuaiqii]QMT00280.1 pyruvate kinase [Gordonia jinghuaiqii]
MGSPVLMSIPEISTALHDLRDRLDRAEARAESVIGGVARTHRGSARNLVHYVAVRRHDLRPLQAAMAAHGLSSLGRMESIVHPWIDTVIETVDALAEGRRRHPIRDDLADGERTLIRNRDDLLGTVHPGAGDPTADGPDDEHGERAGRIMVTMPTEAAGDPELVGRMGAAGMDVARVNCAHDGPAEWTRMIDAVRALPGDVRVAMDLAGPKIRTGPLEPGPEVRKVKPVRTDTGTVERAARVRFSATTQTGQRPPDGIDAVIPVLDLDPDCLNTVDVGARLSLRDARGRRRRLRVVGVSEAGIDAECDRTVYYQTGMSITVSRPGQGENKGEGKGRNNTGEERSLVVGELDEVPQHLLVRTGDEIRLQRDLAPTPATRVGPHRIGCELGEAFDDVLTGHRVLFDDGKIAGRVREKLDDEIVVDVERAGPGGTKLRAGKGINLPDTTLHIPALTAEDRSDLEFVAEHADIVNYSFVRSPDDVADLIDELERLGAHHVGIVLKIETRAAFESLPQMLLEAMRWERVGVMIARGDLAVEVGFGRLAEVQEEILWLCEAAHTPVIWATQVLDGLAKNGVPSRAEVTDAAMSRRAEGVMLNKGPFIVEAIEALTSILDRMGGHVEKKRSLLRPLSSFDLAEH